MPKWKISLVGKAYVSGEIYLEADSWDEAHDKAHALDSNDERITWVSEPFPDNFHVAAALECTK